MTAAVSFGEWIAQRRRFLDLTQRELATLANCALATIKKIELDERRPSRDLAHALAESLQVPQDVQPRFVECARGLGSVDLLSTVGTAPARRTGASAPIGSADLPARSTPLVGRDTQLAEVAELLSQPACRLITLVGVGGAGKTRLAVEIAYQQRDAFADGAVFVPLASVADARLLPLAIAQSLHLVPSGEVEPALFAYLRDKALLLVLDNCEQLVEGIDWLSRLLASVPGVKLLATSRERLLIPEEWTYAVPMLDAAQAVDLFAQTAQRHNPRFQMSEQHAAAVQVCQLVEHLPLAIELAASWTPYLSCEQIAENMRRDLDFLTARARGIPARHHSIRAVFEHSWRLLSPAEQNFLMRLSVFRGGWAPEEAQEIAGATMVELRALMDKSLVRTAGQTGQNRYDMHELIRQYAEEQLEAAGLAQRVRARHAEAYFGLAGKLDSQIWGPDGIAAFSRLDLEQENMRVGMQWALDAQDTELARRCADKLFLYWLRRGRWAVGERWSRAALGRPDEPDSIPLCWTLLNVATFCALQGRYAEAHPFQMRAEAMANRLADPETTARTLLIRGQAASELEQVAAAFEELFVAAGHVEGYSKPGMAKEALVAHAHLLYGDQLLRAGRLVEADAHYHQSLDLLRRMGNVDMIAYPIGNLGRLALQDGRLQEAYDRFMEGLALSRAIGNRVGIADWLQQLGYAALAMNDLSQAGSCFEEALALYQEMGNQRACPDVLAGLGYVAYLQGDREQSRRYLHESLLGFRAVAGPVLEQFHRWTAELQSEFHLCLQTCALAACAEREFEHAVTLLGAADTLVRHHVDFGQEARVTDALNVVRSRLSAQAFAAAWTAGQVMPFEQVVAFALALGPG